MMQKHRWQITSPDFDCGDSGIIDDDSRKIANYGNVVHIQSASDTIGFSLRYSYGTLIMYHKRKRYLFRHPRLWNWPWRVG